MDEERLEAAARRTSETPPGTWLGGAQRGSLWLCYVGSLVEKRKSKISGKRRRMKPISWEKNSLEVSRGGRQGRRASDRAKKRVYRFWVKEKSKSSVMPLLCLGLGND